MCGLAQHVLEQKVNRCRFMALISRLGVPRGSLVKILLPIVSVIETEQRDRLFRLPPGKPYQC